MKKKARVTVLSVICIAAVLGGYLYLTLHRRASVEDAADLTKIQEIITKNLDQQYPATPREVVKLYNRIITCYYDEEYTQDELYDLGDQARKLFDAELLDNNPRDQYFEDLQNEIKDYKERSKTIVSSTVSKSNDVKYETVDGDECAYVTSSYFIQEKKSYSRTYQMYVLRKDEDGNWKILVFYKVEGDSSDE